MAWDLQWGSEEKQKFLQTLVEQGHDPEALRNKPRLKPWLGDYYKAFNLLSTSRQLGMGAAGAIPMSEMMAYFEVFEVHDLDERETTITMIKALDSVYLKHVNKKSEEIKPKGKVPRKRR